MTVFDDIREAFEEGKRRYEHIMADDTLSAEEQFHISELYDTGKHTGISGNIACGDNIYYMAYLIKKKGLKGKLQMIYSDPPFFSNGKYQASVRIMSEKLGDSGVLKIGAYDDRWNGNIKQYLTMLTARLMLMRDLLSETGCLWVHLDWHIVHYVKLILDSIFGPGNFINEVIWTYKSGGTNKRSFARKHDSLLFYSKSGAYKFNILKEKSYNREYKPYRFRGVEEFTDEKGWYTMVNMKDVWNIDMVGRTSSERSGYATQKPEKLLERIVESCSDKGDLCADFFAGSGTLGAVCEKLGRRWIMCDESRLSFSYQIERLSGTGASFCVSDNRMTGTAGKAETEIKEDSVAITGYVADMHEAEKRGVRMGDGVSAEKINEYNSKDGLSMIRMWSVDFDYNGIEHRPDRIMGRGEKKCCFDGVKTGKRISIAGYDVLGGRFLEILERCKQDEGGQ